MAETYFHTLQELSFMVNRNGLPPTMAQLAEERQLSASAIAKHYAVLVKEGLITHTKRSPRSAVLTDAGRRALTRARGKN